MTMQSEIKVLMEGNQEFRISLDGLAALAPDVARRWLDDQFVKLECEPLRMSGKLLNVDRVLCIAQAAGPQLFGDTAWAQDFGRAVSVALGKTNVTIDVVAMTLTY